MTLKRFLLCVHPESLFEQACHLQCGKKDQPNGKSKDYAELSTTRESATLTSVLADDTKAGKGVGKGCSGEKGRLQMCPVGGGCPGKAGGGPRAVGILCDG